MVSSLTIRTLTDLKINNDLNSLPNPDTKSNWLGWQEQHDDDDAHLQVKADR